MMPQDFLWEQLAGGPLEHLPAVNLAALGLVIDGRPGITTALELILYVAGSVSTAAAGLLIVWRIIKPHVVAFTDKRIQAVQAQVAQVSTKVEQVKTQVATPGSTTLESHHLELVGAVEDVRRQLGRLHRRMDKQSERHQHTHDVLQAHVEESAEYVTRAIELLGAQGVQLPQQGHQPQHKEPDA